MASIDAAQDSAETTVPVSLVLGMLKCTICEDVVDIPFKQCKTGHLACDCCLAPLATAKCQQCGSTEFQNNPTCIRKLLESFSRPCHNAGNGCKSIVEGAGYSHERYCEFRKVECIELTCHHEFVQLNQLDEHYENMHHDQMPHLDQTFGVVHLTALDCQVTMESGDRFKSCTANLIFGHFFWIELVLCKGWCEISFNCYPIGKPKQEYIVKIESMKDGQGMSHFLKVCKPEYNMGETACTMKFHLSQLEWFLDNGALILDYTVLSFPKGSLKSRSADYENLCKYTPEITSGSVCRLECHDGSLELDINDLSSCRPKNRYLIIEGSFKKQPYINSNLAVSFGGKPHIFWLNVLFVNNQFEISFHMSPAEESSQDFFMWLELRKANQGLEYTLKASEAKGAVDRANCTLKFDPNSIAWGISSKGNIIFNVEIFSKPKPGGNQSSKEV